MSMHRRRSERDLRAEIVEVCRRLWMRKLVAGTEGNVSARAGGDRYLVTARAVDKGFLRNENIVVVNGLGESLPSAAGDQDPTSELPLHLEVYALRPDVGAVVHAHPPSVVACSVAGIDLTRPILPEAIVALSGIGTSEYARPGSSALAKGAAQAVQHSDAGVMHNHGALTVGEDPIEALHRMEMLDSVAETLLRAYAAGHVEELSAEESEALKRLAARSKTAR
jgi:L-fuculose-phosphate aldolase